MSRVLSAFVKAFLTRNGDTRPTPSVSPGCVSLSLPTTSREGAATQVAQVDEGDGPEPLCSQGCGRPGTCTWECDGELFRVCVEHCGYCSLNGTIDREQNRRRMQTGAVLR